MLIPPDSSTHPHNPDYPTGDLASFISDMNTPKQDFNLSERPEEEEFSEFEQEDPLPREKTDVQMKSSAAAAGGRLFATVIDCALPATMAVIASAPAETFKASESEKDELADALTEYMRLRGADIPPGVMVIILVLSIYGARIPQVLSLRKQAAEKKQNEKPTETTTIEVSTPKSED